MNEVSDFQAIDLPTPSFEALRQAYQELIDALDGAENARDEQEVFERWQTLDGRIESWGSLTRLRFRQDTNDEVRRQELDFCDEIQPKLQEFDVALKRRFLQSEYRDLHEAVHGDHLFALWEADTESFRPEIQEELVALNKLDGDYTELLAKAEIEFEGKTYNLSELRKFLSDPSRERREAADRARWAWAESVGEQLDDLYDRMVKLRHQAAQKLGYEDFVTLGYKIMHRTDYDRHDVERFRDEVRRVVVPLAQELRAYQARQLGVDTLKVWDLDLFDPRGNPAPQGDHDWMVARAQEMFDEMGHGLGEFFQAMNEKGYLDLMARKGKAGGGFCTSFETEKFPFIFANFNGTKGDVEVFTHEMGHAFQYYSSTHFPEGGYHWPTYETAEIHSMSLEFLTWPHMEKFFGEEEAQRFRQIHLIEGLLFLPYGVAVDHFQHLVYERPEATPAERHQMWRELEQQYMPWVDWGGIPRGELGGRWQLQGHIYSVPFYYIDYTLAQSCALQLWMRAEQDRDAAMQTYVALCEKGGSAPFQEVVRGAGLQSPFTAGCLEGVVSHARATLSEVLDAE